eukprot:SM000078S22127  [mRNA]  locus=s78:535637:535976:+ [translate_table: standard]
MKLSAHGAASSLRKVRYTYSSVPTQLLRRNGGGRRLRAAEEVRRRWPPLLASFQISAACGRPQTPTPSLPPPSSSRA